MFDDALDYSASASSAGNQLAIALLVVGHAAQDVYQLIREFEASPEDGEDASDRVRAEFSRRFPAVKAATAELICLAALSSRYRSSMVLGVV